MADGKAPTTVLKGDVPPPVGIGRLQGIRDLSLPDEGQVLETCDRLLDLHAWSPGHIDPRGWLGNFDAKDRPLAVILLSRFTFLADHLTDQLFGAAFQNMSNLLTREWETYDAARERWGAFCDSAIVTVVEGERPSNAQSGNIFVRKARQRLGIRSDQLQSPAEAILLLEDGFTGPVILVDDFVGSGEQFLLNWRRRHDLGGGRCGSLAERFQARPAEFIYCNAMTTEYGCLRLSLEVPGVRVSTGNIIPAAHSLVRSDSPLWPASSGEDGVRFLKRIGYALGYDQEDGGERDWRGFHRLGLSVAFEHGTPDANLPIFFAEEAGWTPLVRKS